MSDLTFMQAHTIADALTSYALQPDSTDARIREVISALQAIGYTETAATMERLNEHSVKA
jgi:hypothetical protein